MYIKGHSLDIRIVRAPNVALIFEQVHLKRFFKYFKVDCVFDVGANNGQYVDMIRKATEYKGPIISFEPIPESAELLRERAKSDPKWYVEEVALDKSIGKKTFNVMASEQFSSLHEPSNKDVELFRNQNKVSRKISVKTSTLDHMLTKYQKIIGFKNPFLKMDTQGHDFEIAKAAGSNLQSFVGIQSELSIKRIYDNIHDYSEVLDYYLAQGFEISAFVPNNAGHFPRLIEMDCIMYNKSHLATTH